jgi:hypothetical protein
VKSKGDFADILAEENPSIWISHRPAESGETGAMFKKIIERALQMRGGGEPKPTKTTKPTKKNVARKSARTPKVKGQRPKAKGRRPKPEA